MKVFQNVLHWSSKNCRLLFICRLLCFPAASKPFLFNFFHSRGNKHSHLLSDGPLWSFSFHMFSLIWCKCLKVTFEAFLQDLSFLFTMQFYLLIQWKHCNLLWMNHKQHLLDFVQFSSVFFLWYFSDTCQISINTCMNCSLVPETHWPEFI